MSDIQLSDLSGDLDILGNDLVIIDKANAIKQLLSQRFRFFKGEWFLDTSKGLPYYQDVLKKNPDPVVVDGVFKAEILDTPGVLGLDSFDIQYDSAIRSLQLDFKATSTDGPVEFNNEVP